MTAEINYVIYQKHKQIVEAATIALKHRLYVPGWMLYRWLQTSKFNPERVRAIVLAYKNEIPVGIMFAWNEYSNYEAGVFVRKIERRQGIGSGMVDLFCQQGYVPKFIAHDTRSKEFFEGLAPRINLGYDLINDDDDCDEEDYF